MKKLFLLLLFLALAGGCATPSAPPPTKVYSADAELHQLPAEITASAAGLQLKTAEGRVLTLCPNSATIEFADSRICLPEMLKLDADGVYHLGERSRRIVGALLKNPTARHYGRRILLDPGHGGHDIGAPGAVSVEKNLNLALALAVENALLEQGFAVELTRRDDHYLTLQQRCDAAAGFDLFISLHHNASPEMSASGLETYAPATPRVNFDESIMLAFLIQRGIVRATGEVDRGMRSARFYVLEHNTIPAVLVEAGFVSTPQEEQKLNQPSRQKVLAAAIADAVVEFYRRVDR